MNHLLRHPKQAAKICQILTNTSSAPPQTWTHQPALACRSSRWTPATANNPTRHYLAWSLKRKSQQKQQNFLDQNSVQNHAIWQFGKNPADFRTDNPFEYRIFILNIIINILLINALKQDIKNAVMTWNREKRKRPVTKSCSRSWTYRPSDNWPPLLGLNPSNVMPPHPHGIGSKRQAGAITPPLKKIQLCYYILLMSTDSNHLCNHDPLGKAQTINLQIQNHKSLTNT